MFNIKKLFIIGGGIVILTACNNAGNSSLIPQSNGLDFLPMPYAGTYYPIYNNGPGQWLPPTDATPFSKVNTIFIAFAHSYPKESGAILDYEESQVAEPVNLASLVVSAKKTNPQIKILISLGWGKNDWSYINSDYTNNANLFVSSVVSFIRKNDLDGLDIDDEDIGPDQSSGYISQRNFDEVISNLRQALNNASTADNKPYYLTITPAGNNESEEGGFVDTQLDATNINDFNLINIQTYFDQEWSAEFLTKLLDSGYPKNRVANGISTEKCDTGAFPDYLGYAGLFNWDMTADSICNDYQYTKQIANAVGYF